MCAQLTSYLWDTIMKDAWQLTFRDVINELERTLPIRELNLLFDDPKRYTKEHSIRLMQFAHLPRNGTHFHYKEFPWKVSITSRGIVGIPNEYRLCKSIFTSRDPNAHRTRIYIPSHRMRYSDIRYFLMKAGISVKNMGRSKKEMLTHWGKW